MYINSLTAKPKNMIYVLTPSMLREKGYEHNEMYHSASLTAIIHRINRWMDDNRSLFVRRAQGHITSISWLTRNDLREFTETEIEEALVWYTKMGWRVEKINEKVENLTTYYVFTEPTIVSTPVEDARQPPQSISIPTE